MRAVMFVGSSARSRRSFSSGNSGVRSSKRRRLRARSGSWPLMTSTRSRAGFFSPRPAGRLTALELVALAQRELAHELGGDVDVLLGGQEAPHPQEAVALVAQVEVAGRPAPARWQASDRRRRPRRGRRRPASPGRSSRVGRRYAVGLALPLVAVGATVDAVVGAVAVLAPAPAPAAAAVTLVEVEPRPARRRRRRRRRRGRRRPGRPLDSAPPPGSASGSSTSLGPASEATARRRGVAGSRVAGRHRPWAPGSVGRCGPGRRRRRRARPSRAVRRAPARRSGGGVRPSPPAAGIVGGERRSGWPGSTPTLGRRRSRRGAAVGRGRRRSARPANATAADALAPHHGRRRRSLRARRARPTPAATGRLAAGRRAVTSGDPTNGADRRRRRPAREWHRRSRRARRWDAPARSMIMSMIWSLRARDDGLPPIARAMAWSCSRSFFCSAARSSSWASTLTHASHLGPSATLGPLTDGDTTTRALRSDRLRYSRERGSARRRCVRPVRAAQLTASGQHCAGGRPGVGAHRGPLVNGTGRWHRTGTEPVSGDGSQPGRWAATTGAHARVVSATGPPAGPSAEDRRPECGPSSARPTRRPISWWAATGGQVGGGRLGVAAARARHGRSRPGGRARLSRVWVRRRSGVAWSGSSSSRHVAQLVEAVDQSGQDSAVPVLEGPHLLLDVAGVARLVAGLDVDDEHVAAGGQERRGRRPACPRSSCRTSRWPPRPRRPPGRPAHRGRGRGRPR